MLKVNLSNRKKKLVNNFYVNTKKDDKNINKFLIEKINLIEKKNNIINSKNRLVHVKLGKSPDDKNFHDRINNEISDLNSELINLNVEILKIEKKLGLNIESDDKIKSNYNENFVHKLFIKSIPEHKIDEVIICLSSIPGREELLINTLKSLINQNHKYYYKINLYLCKNDFFYFNHNGNEEKRKTGFKNFPRNLEEFLINNNNFINIKWVDNIGPYTKYYYCLKENWNKNIGILIADDDRIYPENMVEQMVNLYNEYNCIITNRCFKMKFDNLEDIDKIKYFERDRDFNYGDLSLKTFFCGTGGVLINPYLFDNKLIIDKEKFLKFSPLADDIWLNFCTLMEGIIRFNNGVDNQEYGKPQIHDIQQLYRLNGKKNDHQIVNVTNFFKNKLKNISYYNFVNRFKKLNDEAIVIYSFSRSKCLERCLLNLKKMSNIDKFDIYIFQENCINKFSKKIITSPLFIEECINLAKNIMPNCNIIVNPFNFGIAINQLNAMTFIFNKKKYDRCLFIEDDVILTEESLNNYLNDNELTNNAIGWSFSNINKKLERKYTNDLIEKNNNGQLGFHIWGTTQDKFKKIENNYKNTILNVFKEIDYCSKNTDVEFLKNFKRWEKQNNYKYKHKSQDWLRVHCFNINNMNSLKIIGEYQYIGSDGLHMSRDRFYDMFNYDLRKLVVISYTNSSHPDHFGGVARFDYHLSIAFPDRINCNNQDDLLEIINNNKNEKIIVITDNALAIDVPNDITKILVHHGIARTHQERDSNWKGEQYVNKQDLMLDICNPENTLILSISKFCSDEFEKFYGDKYLKFNRKTLLNSSELNTNIYNKYFSNEKYITTEKIKPVIMGNWNKSQEKYNLTHSNFSKLKELLPNFEFRQLVTKDNENIRGHYQEISNIYSEADIYLSLSIHEGNSYALLDAFNKNLLICCTNVGLAYNDIPDDTAVILDWEKSSDMDYVAEKIRYLWDNRQKFRNKSKEFFDEKCNFENWKNEIKEIVKNHSEIQNNLIY